MERTIVLKVQHLILKLFLRFTINLMGFFFLKELNKANNKSFISDKRKMKYYVLSIFLPLSKKSYPSFFPAQSQPETFLIYTAVSLMDPQKGKHVGTVLNDYLRLSLVY